MSHMESLTTALRTSRHNHQAKTRQHQILLTENHIKILALIHILSNDMPLSVRFIRCCTAFDLGGIQSNLRPPANVVHDWVLFVFIHECIVHKVLDYELTNLHVTSPANTWMQMSLEANTDIEQLRASGLINTFEFSSSSFASTTISGSPYTSGNRRNGMVSGLSLSMKGVEKSKLLLRTGRNELMSIVTADVGYSITVPRRILWHEIRTEFLLCEALDTTEEKAVGGSATTTPNLPSTLASPPSSPTSSRNISISSPSRYRTPLPLPPSPLKLKEMKKNNTSAMPETITRALRSTITAVRATVPNYILSPYLPTCMEGRDIYNANIPLRGSNRMLAQEFVHLHVQSRMNKPTRAQQLIYEAESLNELATVTGTFGVRVILSHWLGGIDANFVRTLNQRLTSGSGLNYGEGVGSSRVFDDNHNSTQNWRSLNEMRSNAGEHHVLKSVHDMKHVSDAGFEGTSDTATAVVAATAAAVQQKGLPKASSHRGVRIIEVLGSTGELGGRRNLRSVFTAECADVSGQMGESVYSVEQDGCVVSTMAIDAIDDKIAYTATAAEANKISSRIKRINNKKRAQAKAASKSDVADATNPLGDAAATAAAVAANSTAVPPEGGVSLNKLSRALSGVQMNQVDVLRGLLMAHNDPTSTVGKFFSDIHGSTRAEPNGYISIVVGSIRPFMKPKLYLDGSEYQLRITQLIGACRAAVDIGFGETLFVGEWGTLLISKRPETLQSTLLEHSRIMSKTMALDAIGGQLGFLSNAISRMVKHREAKIVNDGGEDDEYDGGHAGAPLLSSGEGSEDPVYLMSKLQSLGRCIEMMKDGLHLNTESNHDVEDEDHADKSFSGGRSTKPEEEELHLMQHSATVYGTEMNDVQNKKKRRFNQPSMKETTLHELHRVLQMSGTKRSLRQRIECMEKECLHLRTMLLAMTTSMQNSGGASSAATNTVSGSVKDFTSENSRSNKPERCSGLVFLLSGVVAFMAVEASVVNNSLPWGSERETWSFLGVCVGLWVLIALMIFVVVPRCFCCGGSRAGEKGPTINIKVAPMLRVRTTILERTLLSKARVLSDALHVPRFAIGGSSSTGGNGSTFARRQRKGCRTVVMRESAVNLGWPSNFQWLSRYLTVKMVLVYDGGGGGVGGGVGGGTRNIHKKNSAAVSGDIATIQSLVISIDSAPPHWPFKWLHELVLSKWLQRLEDLNVCSVEDHHVCRQVLRLDNTVGVGSGF